MDKFVTRVTDSVYRRNLRIDSIRDESKKESEVERRVDRDKKREIRHKADHAAAMRRFRANRAAASSQIVESSVEIVEPSEGVLNVQFLPELPVPITKKNWNKRPKHWEDITDYYVQVKKDIKQVIAFYDHFGRDIN